MVFIEDFERTENTDYLHGVIGRCLIIATRFDSMCVTLASAMKYKKLFLSNDKEFEKFVNKISSKYNNLNNAIQELPSDENLKVILHRARESRNEIAHSLTKGLIGCIDNVDNKLFFDKVSSLIYDVTRADLMISIFTSLFNNEPILKYNFQDYYCERIVQWVIEK